MVAELNGLVAFGLSFGALICIWAVHDGCFRRYGLQDTWTIVLNACLLFVVLFYVYPLKFVTQAFARNVPLGAPGWIDFLVGPLCAWHGKSHPEKSAESGAPGPTERPPAARS